MVAAGVPPTVTGMVPVYIRADGGAVPGGGGDVEVVFGEQLHAQPQVVVRREERMAATDGGGAVSQAGDVHVALGGAEEVGFEDQLEGDGLVARGEERDRGPVPHRVVPSACLQGMGEVVLEDLLAVVHGPDRSEVSGCGQNDEQQNDAQRG